MIRLRAIDLYVTKDLVFCAMLIFMSLTKRPHLTLFMFAGLSFMGCTLKEGFLIVDI